MLQWPTQPHPNPFWFQIRPLARSLSLIGVMVSVPLVALAAPALQASYELESAVSGGSPIVQRGVKSPRPGFLLADQIEGQTDEAMIAHGHVELRKSGTVLLADELTYRPLSDDVEAKGNVRFKQAGSEFSGPYMRRNLTDLTGYFDQPSYLIRREVRRNKDEQGLAPGAIGGQSDIPDVRIAYGSGTAQRIDFLGENHLVMNKATFSSCLPARRDWYLQSNTLDLNYDEDDGNSRGSTIFFKDVPVLYWPSISFPLNSARRSGFLPPTFMASTENGLDLTVPYYLNLAPNYDLLLNPRLIAQRGNQLGAELNYLNRNYNGQFRVEGMSDTKAGQERNAYNLVHNLNLGQGVTTQIQWNGVSDGNYFTDLSTRLVETSQTMLPRQVIVNYAPSPWFSTSTRYLSYQVLKEDITRPYALEPQVNLVGRQPDYRGMDLQLNGQVTQFTHPTLVQGQRLVAYPQITLPYESPAFFVRPKIGLHSTQYSLNTQGVADANATESRVLPIFSLNTGAVFERDAVFGGRKAIQTLEPRLYYVNVPYKDQSRIPIFDTGLADFNFAQIFSENRYLGYDRVSDANQLTAAVASRIIDDETGAERVKALIGQRYYFSQQQVSLNSIYPNSATEVARTDNFSSLIAALSGLVGYRTYLDTAWEYSPKEERTMRYSAGARYQPGFGKVLTASYRINRDQATLINQIEQYDLAGQWPINGNWYAVGRYNFSLQDNRVLESIAGVEYNAGCWMGRVVAQKIETTLGQPNTILFFQLELNDFAQLGTNPLQLLRRSIPGYGKVNDVDTGSLIQ